jgi:hypothetical protein
MTAKTVTLSIVCTVAIAVLLGSPKRSSLGQQQQNIRKQPACTIFCGDGTFNTLNLGAKPCWGGPLPADGAGDHFKNLAPEDQAAICRNVSTASPSKASCPAFKALAQLCRGKEEPPNPENKKPECKARGEYDVPWFDPSAEGCQQLQDTRMNANWTSANGGTCTLTLTACNYTVLTYGINLVSSKNGKLEPTSVAGITPTPAQLAAMGIRPIQRSECTTQLYDALVGDHPGKVCCDIWREGVNSGNSCNPETDADCDGLPNDRDNFINSQPYYAPPRPGSYHESFFQGASDFNPANFDPRPEGLSWDEVMPNEPCKKCKWVAQSGKLTCSPDGRTEHEYKATWVCPTTGAQRVVTKRAPASAPCTPPRRG